MAVAYVCGLSNGSSSSILLSKALARGAAPSAWTPIIRGLIPRGQPQAAEAPARGREGQRSIASAQPPACQCARGDAELPDHTHQLCHGGRRLPHDPAVGVLSPSSTMVLLRPSCPPSARSDEISMKHVDLDPGSLAGLHPSRSTSARSRTGSRGTSSTLAAASPARDFLGMVGLAGFEPATAGAQGRQPTRLAHSPPPRTPDRLI